MIVTTHESCLEHNGRTVVRYTSCQVYHGRYGETRHESSLLYNRRQDRETHQTGTLSCVLSDSIDSPGQEYCPVSYQTGSTHQTGTPGRNTVLCPIRQDQLNRQEHCPVSYQRQDLDTHQTGTLSCVLSDRIVTRQEHCPVSYQRQDRLTRQEHCPVSYQRQDRLTRREHQTGTLSCVLSDRIVSPDRNTVLCPIRQDSLTRQEHCPVSYQDLDTHQTGSLSRVLSGSRHSPDRNTVPCPIRI